MSSQVSAGEYDLANPITLPAEEAHAGRETDSPVVRFQQEYPTVNRNVSVSATSIVASAQRFDQELITPS